MPSFQGKFFSIVFLGRQNPQILTHEFLMKNAVLPTDQEPFRELLARQDRHPFTEFVSTPVLVTIRYGAISIVVEENRYQIRDDRLGDPVASPIIKMTKRYFGELLRYTPLQLGGMNLNGTIKFHDPADEVEFDRALGVERGRVSTLAGADDVRLGLTFSAPWSDGTIEVQVSKPKARPEPGRINFNYEFQYQDIDSFLGNVDRAAEVYRRFRELLSSLRVEAAK